jgi:hypothetical protein
VIAGTAVVCVEDLAPDRLERAKQQVTGGLASVGFSGMVQHSQYTFECAGWADAANVGPTVFMGPDGLLTALRRRGLEPAVALAGPFSPVAPEDVDNPLETPSLKSAVTLDNGPLLLGVSLCQGRSSSARW